MCSFKLPRGANMTTLKTTETGRSYTLSLSKGRLPDIPQRDPDEVTSRDQLHKTGGEHYVALHLGDPDTTLVTGDRYIVQGPVPTTRDAIFTCAALSCRRYPDLLIAFDVDPVAYDERNGYVISEQGKPPDFVLEVASASTGAMDVGPKRDDYAALGIPEYWQFDKTGEHHGARLAGDRLVDGEYVPIPIERLSDDTLQGYSEVLNLNIRWHDGQLEWYDPKTNRHIPTFEDAIARAEDERAARIQAETRAAAERTRAANEREARIQADARAETAEARVRQLEAQLRQSQK